MRKLDIIVKNKPNYNIDVEKMLWMPGNVYWKGKHGEYLGCNDSQAECAQLASRSDFVGLTLSMVASKSTAESIEAIDQQVMAQGILKCVIELYGKQHSNSSLYYSM